MKDILESKITLRKQSQVTDLRERIEFKKFLD